MNTTAIMKTIAVIAVIILIANMILLGINAYPPLVFWAVLAVTGGAAWLSIKLLKRADYKRADSIKEKSYKKNKTK